LEALNEGFAASTGGDTSAVAAGIAQLQSAMGGAMAAGSSMTFTYEPAVGTHVYRDNEQVATIEGLAFKRALFGIWLSDKPVAAMMALSQARCLEAALNESWSQRAAPTPRCMTLLWW